MITFKTGDMFQQKYHAVINTVNCHGVMGKGIALEFKNKFPEYFAEYKGWCDNKKLKPGEIPVCITKDNSLILSFATKDHWKDPSRYEWIENGLKVLNGLIDFYCIKSIAIPALGCGNGGLDWKIVKDMITKELDKPKFKDVDITVYEPKQTDIHKIFQWKRCSCKIERGKFDIDNMPLDCPATWNLLSNGQTVGVFQLETKLGQDWSKKVRPQNIEELAALISLLRPACLESGMAEKYVEIKSGIKSPFYLHPSLKPILENTYGVSVYQEQNLKIAKDIAGFSLSQADTLRKSIGKKLPELMSKCRKDFIKGCETTKIVDGKTANEIFDFIEKAQRYQFNKSHAISYSMLCYQTAYLKCHFPMEFYISYLNFAQYKSDPKEEIHNLVQDAKLLGINILPPNIQQGNVDFCASEKQSHTILFGLAHIAGVGESSLNKIKKFETWIEFILNVPALHRNIAEGLVKSGACDHFGMERSRMIKEIELIFGYADRDEQGKQKNITGLTKKEMGIFFEQLKDKNIPEALKHLTLPETKGIITRRKEIVGKKLEELLSFESKDTNTAKATAEKHYLGVSLSCSPADDANTNEATHKCIDFVGCMNDEFVKICCVIDDVRHTKTKKGKNPGSPMAFLVLSDSTYSLDCVVVFPDAYENLKSFCKPEIIALVNGVKKNGSLIVSDIQRLI